MNYFYISRNKNCFKFLPRCVWLFGLQLCGWFNKFFLFVSYLLITAVYKNMYCFVLVSKHDATATILQLLGVTYPKFDFFEKS